MKRINPLLTANKVFGVTGWVWSSIWGVRVGPVPYWGGRVGPVPSLGWSGGCGTVLGVSGCFGGGRGVRLL